MRERHEAVAHHFSTLNHVDECVRVDAAQNQLQLHQIGAIEVGVNHLTLLSFKQSRANKTRSTPLQIVDNKRSNLVDLIGDDECRLVALDAVDHQVDDLAFYHNQED